MAVKLSFLRAIRIVVEFKNGEACVEGSKVYLVQHRSEEKVYTRRNGKTFYYEGDDLNKNPYDKRRMKEDPDHVNVYYLLYIDSEAPDRCNYLTSSDTVLDHICRVTHDLATNFDASDCPPFPHRMPPASQSPLSPEEVCEIIGKKQKKKKGLHRKDYVSSLSRDEYFQKVFGGYMIPVFLRLLQTPVNQDDDDVEEMRATMDFKIPRGDERSTELFVSYATKTIEK